MMRRFAISFAALALAGCAAQAEQVAAPALSKEAVATQIGEKRTPMSPPTGQQWLYGSAEGSIASAQVYKAMTTYVLRRAAERPMSSVIIQDVIELDGDPRDMQPGFETCGNKPLAAVFDADETLIWNVGAMRYMAEQGKDFDPAIWNEWEKTGAGKALAMPGAVMALKAMRDAGVTIIANTNRSVANAKGTEDALRAAGLGEFKHGETLFLMGDTPDGSSKNGRRSRIASKYCVIAMAGDQLGDFWQLFNDKSNSVSDRKAMVLANYPAITSLWGNGWFLFSNPVYGPSIRGGYDEIFTPETKWEPTP
jgi:5'-nucleotidase (lipoprotein e(P4) family)